MVRGRQRRPCKLRPASAGYIVLAHRKSKSALPAQKPRGESKGGFTPRRLQAALHLGESPTKNRTRSCVNRIDRESQPSITGSVAPTYAQDITYNVVSPS